MKCGRLFLLQLWHLTIAGDFILSLLRRLSRLLLECLRLGTAIFSVYLIDCFCCLVFYFTFIFVILEVGEL
jgi:hypothetical protein